jgi:hypothetical protein
MSLREPLPLLLFYHPAHAISLKKRHILLALQKSMLDSQLFLFLPLDSSYIEHSSTQYKQCQSLKLKTGWKTDGKYFGGSDIIIIEGDIIDSRN